jgi:hypothetical protein
MNQSPSNVDLFAGRKASGNNGISILVRRIARDKLAARLSGERRPSMRQRLRDIS